MKKMSYAEAIREGMSIRMREDPNVLLFGEDVGAFGGCFGGGNEPKWAGWGTC